MHGWLQKAAYLKYKKLTDFYVSYHKVFYIIILQRAFVCLVFIKIKNDVQRVQRVRTEG